MNKSIITSLAAASFIFAGQAALAADAPKTLEPQQHGEVYTSEQLFIKDVDSAGGGKGILHGEFAFRREQALPKDAIKEIGWMTLKPGTSIGLHSHTDNEDAYLIISGRGVFTDSEGNTHQVGPGDVTIARRGQSHGLANQTMENLVFLDIIAKNDAAKPLGEGENKDQQLYTTDKFIVNNLVQFSGGLGITQGKVAFLKSQSQLDNAFTEIGMATLRFGTSIGKHEHTDDENAYIILYGKGVYTDSSGQEHVLKPMSMAIASPGQSHAIRNDSMDDLVFITVTAKNHNAGGQSAGAEAAAEAAAEQQ